MLVARFLVLTTTFVIGALAAWFLQQTGTKTSTVRSQDPPGYATAKPLNEPETARPTDSDGDRPLTILHKQKAQYTDIARENGIEGTVTLRVTFLSSGEIGTISVIKGLPDGLTEQAIAAARKFRFEPEIRHGIRATTTRPVTYSFDIY